MKNKMIDFANRFYAGAVEDDVWQYVPEDLKCAVEDAAVDESGYWVWLEDGWSRSNGERFCHAYSIAELKKQIKTIEKRR